MAKKRLGKVLAITSAARVHKEEWSEKGVPFFRTSDVVAEFKGISNKKAFIPIDLYNSLSNKIGRVKKDDILITGGGSIGIPYLVRNNEPLYFKDADLLWIKTTNEINGYFLYSYFLSQPFKRYIKSISHVGTIAHYTVIQAKNTPCYFPISNEQTKIANFHTAIDKRITLLQKKKAELERYKKGLMQKLFSQTIRFKDEKGNDFPDWEEKKLGEVGLINPKCQELPNSFIYIDIESVTKGQLVKEDTILKKDAPSRAQRLLKKGDILYQMVRPYQKNNFLFSLDQSNYVASTGYAQIRTKEETAFLFHLLHTESFVNKVIERCTGTSYPAINSSDLGEIKVNIPIRHEQQKIASFLSAIDQKIEHTAVQVEKMQAWKKGLLQRMFV